MSDKIDVQGAARYLDEELSQTRSGICTLIIKNLVPPNIADVIIVAAGAVFFYLGGGNDTDAQNGLLLHYNESIIL